ncbi:hypothetical protein BV20DRAFT_969587 [Pilatotrama ljubarskyi]|nr:hypothetical protein BV20DRAFT_969587 [Pilatotrama ljubarskyi]
MSDEAHPLKTICQAFLHTPTLSDPCRFLGDFVVYKCFMPSDKIESALSAVFKTRGPYRKSVTLQGCRRLLHGRLHIATAAKHTRLFSHQGSREGHQSLRGQGQRRLLGQSWR